MNKAIYPMTFHPVYKDYPWGGTRIPETFNRQVPAGIYAESWEISDRQDGMSIVANGELKGQPLHDVLQDYSREILGRRVQGTGFPLLIKLIDARLKLSVQVHPNDETARLFGGEPKTEMWYLLGDNESRVYCGLKDGVTRESFLQAVDEGTSGDTLRIVPVKKDDVVFVRGGTVHAIDEGCLILEIQQNSNTTYRIYDWDRMGNDGKPRELHIEQALNVINWDDSESPLMQPKLLVHTNTMSCWELLQSEYFRLEKLVYTEPQEVHMDGSTFHALFIADGEAEIRWESDMLRAPGGTSILIPASLPAYTLTGAATVLRTSIP